MSWDLASQLSKSASSTIGETGFLAVAIVGDCRRVGGEVCQRIKEIIMKVLGDFTTIMLGLVVMCCNGWVVHISKFNNIHNNMILSSNNQKSPSTSLYRSPKGPFSKLYLSNFQDISAFDDAPPPPPSTNPLLEKGFIHQPYHCELGETVEYDYENVQG